MALSQTLSLTSPHKRGKMVADVQFLLAGNNVFKQKFYNGPLDSEYGPLTAAAAHRAKVWLGYPQSVIDNNFGVLLYGYLSGTRTLPVSYKLRRETRLALAKAKAKKTTKQQKALNYAHTFANYREASGNHTKFGAWYKLDGNPWCAMFCSYVIDHVGGAFHYSYVPSVVADARAGRNGLFVTQEPKPGDLVCFDWDGNGVFDHIGFFYQWLNRGAGKFGTCEGNTLPEGGTGDQSNGGGVYARVRYTQGQGRVVFVRWN